MPEAFHEDRNTAVPKLAKGVGRGDADIHGLIDQASLQRLFGDSCTGGRSPEDPRRPVAHPGIGGLESMSELCEVLWTPPDEISCFQDRFNRASFRILRHFVNGFISRGRPFLHHGDRMEAGIGIFGHPASQFVSH